MRLSQVRVATWAMLHTAVSACSKIDRREPYAASTRIDHDLYVDVHERYLELLKTDMPSANLSYTIQPVSKATVMAGQQRGGNALGLEVTPQSCKFSHIGNASIVLSQGLPSPTTCLRTLGYAPLVEWFDDDADDAAHYALNSLGKHVISSAEERGKLLEYQFMNDASYTQTILDSYGSENVNMLKDVARKYDPEGVFQKLQHDGFLLKKL